MSLEQRKPIRRVSKKKAKADRVYAKARAAVYDRDGHCQARDRMDGHHCDGPLHVHHIRLRSQGGGHELDNLVLLCEAAHTWAHAHPSEASLFGLIALRPDVEEAP